MSIWDRYTTTAFKRMGDPFTTTVSGSVTTFYGVLDRVEAIENDQAGNSVIVLKTVVRAATSEVQHVHQLQTITRGAQTWVVRLKQWEGDGDITVLTVVESN